MWITIVVIIVIIIIIIYFFNKQHNNEIVISSNNEELNLVEDRLKEIAQEYNSSILFTLKKGIQSYTENKKHIHLCMSGKDGKIYDINILMRVGLHELAHVLCKDVLGKDDDPHTENWKNIFISLLEKAKNKGWYDPNKPMIENYCPA